MAQIYSFYTKKEIDSPAMSAIHNAMANANKPEQKPTLKEWCRSFRERFETELLVIIVSSAIGLGWSLNSIFNK